MKIRELDEFWKLEEPVSRYFFRMKTPGWLYRCAESACPVFWKSPVRVEEIIVPEVLNAAEPPYGRDYPREADAGI